MKISIVTTLYYSASHIGEFHRRIKETVKEITEDYEIIMVNDGSPDDSLKKALEILEKDQKLKIIDLSRNFGHHRAIMTGLSHASGDYIFLIDCDLEEEPELLKVFWNELTACEGTDVVFGVQERRKGSLFEKITGNLYYKIFNLLSDIEIPSNLITCRIMTGRYVKALLEYKEQELFLGGVFASAGFRQKALKVNKASRGVSTYTLRKKVALAINSITSFSSKPLVYIFYLGFFTTLISFLTFAGLIFKKIYYGVDIMGWTSTMISLWLIGGLIIFSLGVIGIYLSRMFNEIKHRPYTIIKDIYEK